MFHSLIQLVLKWSPWSKKPVFFSDFYKNLKGKEGELYAQKLKFYEGIEWYSDTAGIDIIAHVWFWNCLPKAEWHSLTPDLRNSYIQDFVDTLYSTSDSFDIIYQLLFSHADVQCKFIKRGTGQEQIKQLGFSYKYLQNFVEDIYRYAYKLDLKFSYHKDGREFKARLIDIPLNGHPFVSHIRQCSKKPLYVSLLNIRPDIVRMLLNYGVKIPYEDVCNCEEGEMLHPLQIILMDIKEYLGTERSEQNKTKRKEGFALCLKVLLVDLLYTSVLRKVVCETLNAVTGQEMDVLPTLKHISRARVRNLLKEGPCFWEKNVFKSLPLPESLILYVGIDECSVDYKE